MMQDKFKSIIGVQLMSSTLVVCFILYQLTNTPLMSFRYLQFVMYMACMMSQVFFYCWYGNELTLKVLALNESRTPSPTNPILSPAMVERRGRGHDLRDRLDRSGQRQEEKPDHDHEESDESDRIDQRVRVHDGSEHVRER